MLSAITLVRTAASSNRSYYALSSNYIANELMNLVVMHSDDTILPGNVQANFFYSKNELSIYTS